MNTQLLWLIINSFTSIIDLIICYTFLNSFLERKQTGAWVVYSVIILTWAVNTLASQFASIINILLVTSVLTYTFMSFSLFQGGRYFRLFSGILIVSLGAVTEVVTLFLIAAINNKDIIYLHANIPFHIQGIVISKLLLFFTIKVLSRFKERKSGEIPLKYWLMLIVMLMISLLVTSQVLSISINAGKLDSIASILSIFGLLFINLSTFALFEGLIRKNAEQVRYKLVEQQLKCQLEHYKELNENYRSIRSIWHDMRNHCQCILAFVKAGEFKLVEKYISDLNYEVENSMKAFYTGNPVLDALIESKKKLSELHGVRINVEALIPKSINIEPIDICVILGNALDNAIEACSEIKDEGIDKEITVKLSYQNRYLVISVSNPYISPPQIKNGIIFTRKKDPAIHGIGLQNIENTVKKYNGNMQISFERNIFSLNIVILTNHIQV